MIARALDLWRRGLSIFPVPRPRPGVPEGHVGDGKRPAIAWKAFQTRRATEHEIRAWFAAPQNIGIVTGSVSGVVVIDGDSPEALRWLTRTLPYSPWQTATARGFHVFFRHPGVPVRNRARLDTGAGKLAIDVRGDGGFVIGPGSLHASGHVYTEAGDWRAPISSLPIFDPSWLAVERPRPVATRPAARPTGDVAERARRYLAACPLPEIGQGSDVATLTAACRLVRGFGLDEDTAIALLDERFGGRPGWDRDWLSEKVANAARYGTEPIGGLL